MSNDKLRRQIACEAARLMYVRQESEYYRAKTEGGPPHLPGLGQAGRSAHQSRNPRRDPVARPPARRQPPHRQPARNAGRGAADDAAAAGLSPAADRQHDDRPRPPGLRHRPARLRRQRRRHHRGARAEGCTYDVERQARPQARRGADLHAHSRAGPLSDRAHGLRRRPGPLRLQKLGHRQGDRAGQHRRAGAVPGRRVSRPRPGGRAGRSRATASIAFRFTRCCCCRWKR